MFFVRRPGLLPALMICALPGALGSPLHAAKPPPQIGLVVRTLTPGPAADLSLGAGTQGVVVLGIMTGSPAGANSDLLSKIVRASAKIKGNIVETFTPRLLFTPSRTNIAADPLFIDPMKGNYRLAADSPRLGRGRGKADIGPFSPAPEAGESGGRRRVQELRHRRQGG